MNPFRILIASVLVVAAASTPALAWSPGPGMDQQYGASRFSDPDESVEQFGSGASSGRVDIGPSGRSDGGGRPFSVGPGPSGTAVSPFSLQPVPSSDGPGWRPRDGR